MDKTAGKTPEPVATASAAGANPQAPVTPVRSAKDAINAMYANNSGHGLSDYLATSAKDIINASSRAGGDSKSAANLHRGSINHQLESARPSASSILKSDRPKTVVKTSLKLGPKKAPSVVNPQTLQRNTSRRTIDLSAKKGSTSLEEILAHRRARAAQPAADDSIQVMQHAARQATGVPDEPVAPKHVPRPKTRAPRGLMQDVIRPARPGATNPVAAQPTTAPKASKSPRLSKSADNHPNTRSGRPIDSIKRRFRPAPKDYVAEEQVQPDAYVGFDQHGDFEQPVDFDLHGDSDRLEDQPPTPTKQPVEIYGLMDEEPTGKPAEGLGVVEDYNPTGQIHEQKVAQGSGSAAPDNNKHVLGGQSPFFLKSVSVEKRPLSDGPKKSRDADAPAGTLYEKPSSEPVSNKNVYTKKEKESKKSLPTKPTVIIPASRRSKAPLIFLLILTVILGAAVGAFIYLCFFQYLE